MNTQTRWAAVKTNDAGHDGTFVYAVVTTGVYCRPSCPSRLPKKENVRFFETPAAAEAAGFRACKRCGGGASVPAAPADLVAKACRFIEASDTSPTLAQVAKHAGMSPSHFQRMFTKALGISPRSFADAARQKKLRGKLAAGDDIAGALYEAGYGSSSRVYEFAHRYLGMTPDAYRQGGKAEAIWFTIVESSLGRLLVAATPRGICKVALGDDEAALRAELAREFHAAERIEADAPLRDWTQALIAYLDGGAAWPTLPYDVKATAFQRRVWDWLRTIPPGETCNYAEVAEAIGAPKAARAVARACATNPVALVIPCHRIVPKSGGSGGYRWGPARKVRLLDKEASRS